MGGKTHSDLYSCADFSESPESTHVAHFCRGGVWWGGGGGGLVQHACGGIFGGALAADVTSNNAQEQQTLQDPAPLHQPGWAPRHLQDLGEEDRNREDVPAHQAWRWPVRSGGQVLHVRLPSLPGSNARPQALPTSTLHVGARQEP